MANFCENCGSPLKEGYKFCENCGAPIKPDAEPENVAGSFAAGAAATAAAAAGMASDRHNAPGQQASAAPITGRETPFITKSAPPTPLPEKQRGPASDFTPYREPARDRTGQQYEPDEDLQSMFLRYDNRLNRKPYIIRGCQLWAVNLAVGVVIGLIAGFLKTPSITYLSSIFSIACAVPSIMLLIRRLHDLNRPGWWCLGMLIPLLNIVLAVYVLFFKGTDGPNDYGPDPLG